MNSKISIIFATLAIILGSCASTKKVPYMVDAETISNEELSKIASNTEPTVLPGDLLEITVMSYNLEAVRPFNRASFVNELNRNLSNYNTDSNRNTYYIVDDKGEIEFPVIGKLKVGGLNKSQIQEMICNEIYPKYMTERPGVDVRFKNFKVSVIGEVARPGVYTATNEHITILEAIALAGDLTITGKRENIMLIRTDAAGKRSVHRLDLNDKALILSPYFNLQQNDVIYVQPNASKARSSWSIPPALTLTLSSIGTLVSIATLIVTITK